MAQNLRKYSLRKVTEMLFRAFSVVYFLFSLNVLFDSELTNNIIVADSSMNSWEAAWPSGLGKSGGPWFKSSALLLSGFVTW